MIILGTQWYLDDILAYSETIDDHNEHLRILFQRARARNFRFSISKSNVGVSHMTFLGHVIGNGTMKSCQKTINKINGVSKLAKLDATEKQWQQIMGFYNFSQRYIQSFSKQRRISLNNSRRLF